MSKKFSALSKIKNKTVASETESEDCNPPRSSETGSATVVGETSAKKEFPANSGAVSPTKSLQEIIKKSKTKTESKKPIEPELEDEPEVSSKEFQYDSQKEKYSSEEVKEIQAALETLKNSIDQPEIVGQALRSIMHDMQTNPNLVDLLAPEDIGLMVRGLRESYGVAIAKKQQYKSKRKRTEEEVDNTIDELKGLGIEL